MLHRMLSDSFLAWGWVEHTVITLGVLIQYPASALVGNVCHPDAAYVNTLGM